MIHGVVDLGSNTVRLSIYQCEEGSARLLMNRKGTYFVPLQQDDFRAKPTSCVADFAQILPAAEAALAGRQLQPMIF